MSIEYMAHDGTRFRLPDTDWQQLMWEMHQTIVKRWPVGSPEDVHFLALALGGEVGELQNVIKKDWRGDPGDRSKALADELADVRIYLELLARVVGVDLDEACWRKLPELYTRWPDTITAEMRS